VDKFEMYVEIRGMLNQKYSISTIARKLDISRNTVYKYIRKSPKGRKPFSSHDDLVFMGSGKNVEIVREHLLQEQIEELIKETGSI
jgi:transposase-like protein